MTNTHLDIASPCISECKKDPITALCAGCYRSMDEIKSWGVLDNDTKLNIVKDLHNRRADINGTPKRNRPNRRRSA